MLFLIVATGLLGFVSDKCVSLCVPFGSDMVASMARWKEESEVLLLGFFVHALPTAERPINLFEGCYNGRQTTIACCADPKMLDNCEFPFFFSLLLCWGC
jgi:hypothetical protein